MMKVTPEHGKAIDTVEKVELGGADQWISLRSENTDYPLILFLHGGPGSAQISFSRKSQKKLEKDFLVVNWDQRGSGKSYSRKIRKEDMTIERFLLDTEELIEYLLKRFGQRQLFLVGHSWGTILGIKIAAKRPELIRAYIGIGQVVDVMREEEVSYEFTLREAVERGNFKARKELESIGHPPYAKLRDAWVQKKWLEKFNGSTYEGTTLGVMLRNFTLSDTNPLDLVKFVRGMVFSYFCLEEQLMKVNIQSEIKELSVPVYFCTGRRDYNVPSELVVEFAEKLIAPKKEIVWFERSAHMPSFEEPEKFCDFCRSLIAKFGTEN